MRFDLEQVSLNRLVGVHPDLVRVVKLAAKLMPDGPMYFRITEGVRTLEKQREYVESGASWTMNSRHLTGKAVDLAAMFGRAAKWDWPLYYQLADAMFRAAAKLNIPIEWGGHWKGKKKDGPHFQLPWSKYP